MPRLLHIFVEHDEAELVVLLVGAATTADTPKEVNEGCIESSCRLVTPQRTSYHMKVVVIDSGDHSTDTDMNKRSRPVDVARIGLRWCIPRHCPNNSVLEVKTRRVTCTRR